MQRNAMTVRRAVSILLLVPMAASCLVCSLYAQPPAAEPAVAQPVNEPTFRVTSPKSTLMIVEKFSKIVELPQYISRVDGHDPEVIKVEALAPNQVRVLAAKQGITQMTLTDENGNLYEIEVLVEGDARHLQAVLNRMFPKAAISAVPVNDSIVLRGWVTQPEHIPHVLEVAETFFSADQILNQLTVAGNQQVLLNVKVLEVQRTKIRRAGLNFLWFGEDGFFSSTPGGLMPLGGIESPIGGPAALSIVGQRLADTTMTGGIITNSGVLNGFIDHLRQESMLKIHAEPKLVATNGGPAYMLSGGRFPILVPQSLGTVTTEWREFGVYLEAVPLMLGDGRVKLQLHPEVSERDFANAVEVNGFVVPAITTREAQTEVTMRFGETFVIAGLIFNRETASTNKTPFLGELPGIGSLFRRIQYDEGETELIILVTPQLVGPMTPSQVPPGGPGQFTDTPTDRELIWDGMIEVPNYGDHCEGCVDPGMNGPTPIEGGYPTMAPAMTPEGGGMQISPGPSMSPAAEGLLAPPENVPAPAPAPAEPGEPAESEEMTQSLFPGESDMSEGEVSAAWWTRQRQGSRTQTVSGTQLQSGRGSRWSSGIPGFGDKSKPDAQAIAVEETGPGAARTTERRGLIGPKPGLIKPDATSSSAFGRSPR